MSDLRQINRPTTVWTLVVLTCVAHGQVQPKVSGVLETYFLTNSNSQGAYQQMTWAEVRARVTKNWSTTWSGYDVGSRSAYDEAYVRYETDLGSIRAGRLRTSFGFSDWSENFYNGFNHKPLVRQMTLVASQSLDRDDAGAEISTNFGPLQIQAALIDVTPTKAQVAPSKTDHATLTAQYALGPATIGLDLLTENDGSQKIYGANIRYTIPRWIFKGEAFEGVGPKSASGGYLDATYRIPSLTRTQIVWRTDRLKAFGSDAPTWLHTVGVRQIFSKYLTANLNYGWGDELDYSSYATKLGLSGWTARALLQVPF